MTVTAVERKLPVAWEYLTEWMLMAWSPALELANKRVHPLKHTHCQRLGPYMSEYLLHCPILVFNYTLTHIQSMICCSAITCVMFSLLLQLATFSLVCQLAVDVLLHSCVAVFLGSPSKWPSQTLTLRWTKPPLAVNHKSIRRNT